MTSIDAATPALDVLRPKVAASEMMSSLDKALTARLPAVAVRLAPWSTCAVVCRFTTPTVRPMPTPALPEDAPMPPAKVVIWRWSVAETSMSFAAVTTAWSLTNACVSMK